MNYTKQIELNNFPILYSQLFFVKANSFNRSFPISELEATNQKENRRVGA